MSFSIKHEVAVVVDVVADVVVDVVFDVSGFIQQSSPSPQGQLLRPQTREPSQSESLSQSPSPSLQRPLPPSLQHSSLPSFCHLTSFRGAHGPVEDVVVDVVEDVVVDVSGSAVVVVGRTGTETTLPTHTSGPNFSLMNRTSSAECGTANCALYFSRQRLIRWDARRSQ